MQPIQFPENLLAQVVEASPSAVLLADAQGRILLANAQTEKLFGYSRAELLGQPVEILIPARMRGGHPEMRRDFFHAPVPRPMGAGRDLYGLRKDGTEVPIEIGLNPVKTGEGICVIASIIDITQRKQAEESLLRERDRLRTLIDNLPDCIYVKDSERRFLVANAAVARLMGVASPEELIGQQDEDFYPEHAVGEFREDEEKVLRGESLMNKDEPRTDHEGRVTEILTTKIPLRDRAGKVVGLVGISRDITQLKLKELALQQALDHVKTLHGLLPICAYCHKIRNAEGKWEKLEAYLCAHTNADFTHGYCPECMEKYYGVKPGS